MLASMTGTVAAASELGIADAHAAVAAVAAVAIASDGPGLPALAAVVPKTTAVPVLGAVRTKASPSQRLADEIAGARAIGLVERGVRAANEALVDCQRGDYPGGGWGLLSFAALRANAQSDHCRRF